MKKPHSIARGGSAVSLLAALSLLAGITSAQEARTGWRAAFEPAGIIATGAEPFAIELADVDDDGDIDAVTVSRTDSTVAWQENTDGRGGAWLAHTITTASAAPLNFALADFNDDDFPDVVVASSGEDRVDWYQNPGTPGGAWAAHSIYAPPAQPTPPDITTPTYLVVADMDDDGDTDVVVASYTDRRVTLLINGDGAGQSWTRQTLSSNARDTLGLAVGDLTGEGDIDVVSLSTFDDSVGALINDGATPPIFASIAIEPTGGQPSTVNFPSNACIDDFDGDGRADIAVVSILDSKLSLYTNLGGSPPTFAASTLRSFPPLFGVGFNGLFRATAFDADRDGDADIATASLYDGQVGFLENRLSEGLGWPFTTVTAAASGATHVGVGDIDGDGRVDMASSASYAGRFEWYRNVGGQWDAAGIDRAPALATPSTTTPLATLRIHSFGRAGDEALSLDAMTLGFTSRDGTTITLAQAAPLLETIHIHLDGDQDGAIGGPMDALIESIDMPSTGATELTVALNGANIPPGDTVDFLIAADIRATAESATPAALRLSVAFDDLFVSGIETFDPATRHAGPTSFLTKSITADGVPPAAPTILGIDPDTGVAGDAITNQAAIAAGGSAEPHATVTLLRNGAAVGTGLADALGAWRIDAGILGAGRSTLTARATDGAGNQGPLSSSFFATLDLVAPTVQLGAPDLTATRSGPVRIPVVFAGQNRVDLSPAHVAIEGTGITGYQVATTANQITVSAITGDGSFTVRVLEGAASDNSGNATAASGPSATILVDNTPPAVDFGAPTPSRARSGSIVYTLDVEPGAIPAPNIAALVGVQATGTANGSATLTGNQIAIASLGGTGTLSPTLAAGAFADAMGNATPLLVAGDAAAIDNSPPSATFATLGDGIVVGEPMLLEVAGASEPIQTTQLWVRFDGAAWTLASGPLVYTPARVDDAADGLYEFYVRLGDDLGNLGPAPVPGTPPSGSILFNSAGGSWYRRDLSAGGPFLFPAETGRAVELETDSTGGIVRTLWRDDVDLAPANLDPALLAGVTLVIEANVSIQGTWTIPMPAALDLSLLEDIWVARDGVVSLAGGIVGVDPVADTATITLDVDAGMTTVYLARPGALLSAGPEACP